MRPGWIPFLIHNTERDYRYIERAGASAIKLYLHCTGNGTWQRLRSIVPNAFYLAVDVARSDSVDLSNPRGDAETGARELDKVPAAVRRLMGKNELLKIGDTAAKIRAWVDYHVAFTERCHQLGVNVAVGAVNTGHPGIQLFGDPVDQWALVQAVDDAMNDGDVWDLHEYWTADGPLVCSPWTTRRHMRCPTKHKIVIGEYGYDAAVFAPDGTPNHGWGGKLTENQYVDHIIQYHRMITDPRVVGTCAFLLDFQDKHWESWDISGLMDRIIARISECDTVLPEVVMPSRLHLPVESYVGITQTYEEHKKASPKGGWGLDFSCYTGTNVLAPDDGVIDKALDYGAESYGRMVQVNHYWGFTRTGHLSGFVSARGDKVVAGQHIAESGNTGNSTGPHLHFEVIPFSNRVWPWRVDPAPLFGLGGGVVPPAPVPDAPTPAAPVTASDLEKGRIHASAVNLFDRMARERGYTYRHDEWQEGAYTLTVVQHDGTQEWVVMKCPTGRWLESLVTFGTVPKD